MLDSFSVETADAATLPQWHKKNPHLVDVALEAAQAAAPHLSNLAAYCIPQMPRRPLASQTIRAITQDRHSDPFLLDTALTLPWLSWDSQHARNVIAIDIDHPDGAERVDELAAYGLHRPILVFDPRSGHSHAIFRLQTPVITTKGARVGPQILLDLAGRLLAAAMGGTLLHQRALLKNPWGLAKNLIGRRRPRGPNPAVPAIWEAYRAAETGLMWHTEPGDLGAYELREIVAALADDYGEAVVPRMIHRAVRRHRPPPSNFGRNCCLFDTVRFWAYDQNERDGCAILNEAQRVNADFRVPLPLNEVTATARSISRFMNTRFHPRTGAGGRRGRDRDAGVDLDRRGRQEVAGRVSAASRASATDVALQAACTRLRAAGRPLTQAALAAEAGRSLSTVKRRWHVLGMVSDAALSGSGWVASRGVV